MVISETDRLRRLLLAAGLLVAVVAAGVVSGHSSRSGHASVVATPRSPKGLVGASDQRET